MAIKIVKIFAREIVLLFQDMFPISGAYIDKPYLRNGNPYRINNPKIILELEKNANRLINMLRQNIKFMPTQPNSIRIEKMLLNQLNIDEEHLFTWSTR